MQVATQWQTAYYTPPPVVFIPRKPVKPPRVKKTKYERYCGTPTMMRIKEILRVNPGSTAAHVMHLANTSSANLYLRLLAQNGIVEFDLKPVAGRPHLVKHFTLLEAA